MVSFVLRLVEAPLAAGELVGQVVVVTTGEARTFRDVADLVTFLTDHAEKRRVTWPPEERRVGDSNPR